MEALLKDTLAGFLKIDAASISPATVIDRSALGNSILLHRLYARFSQQGIEVPNYNSIRTFGDLISKVNGNGNESHTKSNLISNENRITLGSNSSSQVASNLGIDIENANNFESSSDYREASFYKANFSAEEISYCLLQPNSLLSFAGLFAAKEAIVKADNSYQGVDFNSIEIKHDKLGKPVFKNFSISISHTDSTAVAVAFLPPQIEHSITPQQTLTISPPISNHESSSKQKKIQLLLLLVSLFSLVLAIYAVLKLSR